MDVGVIIGRFQTDELHDAHIALIAEAFKRHDKVLIFIGVSPITGTRTSPLDFPSREKMVRICFPDAIILPALDHEHDEDWSVQIDRRIREVFPNVSKASLYGGRDSFIGHYKGVHQTVMLDTIKSWTSATDRRKKVGRKVLDTADFRRGIIYASENSFPGVKMAVDIAMTRYTVSGTLGDVVDGKGERTYQVLMGRKDNENGWRLIGGMVDPKDESLMFAARREFSEETGMSCESDPRFIGSYQVKDWRFRKVTELGVLTALFHAEYSWGAPKAADDLCELEWFDLQEEAHARAIEAHKPLIDALIGHLGGSGGR